LRKSHTGNSNYTLEGLTITFTRIHRKLVETIPVMLGEIRTVKWNAASRIWGKYELSGADFSAWAC
jgi:hypothetical protein